MIRLEEEWLYTVLEMFFPHEEHGAGADDQVRVVLLSVGDGLVGAVR